MKFKLVTIPGSIVAPQGFSAGGVFCDIKRLGTGKGSDKGQKRDLAIILSQVPSAAAGMFTTNQVCAAPVKVCIARLKRGRAQVIVVNSGNANACTGKQGLKDANEMVRLTEKSLGLPHGFALVGSTGRIGLPLPMNQVRSGILAAARQLGSTTHHAAYAAEAIMTSDTRAKETAFQFELSGKPVCLGGICKGAGMIQPGMSHTGGRPPQTSLHATMLCFLTTDAAVEPKALQTALRQAVAQSFNRITVDGDMSTNDTVLVLANGLAGNVPIRANALRKAHSFLLSKKQKSSPLNLQTSANKHLQDAMCFQNALNQVCLELAKMIVRDGEGVSRFVTVRLKGAKTLAQADAAARAVANSALVKTSWHGGDPNWGRIIDALGYSPATVIEEKVDIGYSSPGSSNILWSLKRGQPTAATFKQLCAAVAAKEFDLHIGLNLGKFNALIYAADLTEEYVEFNKGDVSDPGSLGG